MQWTIRFLLFKFTNTIRDKKHSDIVGIVYFLLREILLAAELHKSLKLLFNIDSQQFPKTHLSFIEDCEVPWGM